MKFLAAMAGTMSGSLGGMTASRNRGGQYFRQRVVPTDPNSTAQALVRGYMAAAVEYWGQTLTSFQRDAWGVYAANTPTTDSLGQELVLTGQQMFIRSAVVRARAGEAFVDDAPTAYDRGQPPAGIQLTIGGEVNSIGIDGSDLLSATATLMGGASDDGDVVLQMGRPVGPAVNFYAGPYRFVNASAIAAAATSVALTATDKSLWPYTEGVVGQRRPIRACIAYDDGRVSTPFEIIAAVVDDAP